MKPYWIKEGMDVLVCHDDGNEDWIPVNIIKVLTQFTASGLWYEIRYNLKDSNGGGTIVLSSTDKTKFKEYISPRQQFINVLQACFEEEQRRLIEDPEYVDEYLRENGYNPDEVAARGIALVNRLKKETRDKLNLKNHE